ncbi:hypothetical protein AMJ87_05570 [candidate division WOR_3 bacterium SM23_60]|uniref:N-acetyltransferase domain-containing protein n=1 Tax=candidate division WOR_3 bacterium SM23_60 TaxID=1703780 RepID=A0A0S8GHA2_UNCW3|nr:MAG: hypothetical protein AMJ87_05570 [candidate division WOR_3 bacterium SM23_60]
MKEIIIRHAHLEDIDQLSKLYAEFHEFHVRGVPGRLVRSDSSHTEELRVAIQKIIASKNATVFVAEIDDQLVGLGEVYIREDSPSPLKVQHTYGHLQSMIVTKAYRGRGVGTKILRAVEQWAKTRGAAEIRLDTWEFREGPLEFYEKYGYRTLRRTLVRKL